MSRERRRQTLEEVRKTVNLCAGVVFGFLILPIGVGIFAILVMPFLLMGEHPEIGIPLLLVYAVIFIVFNAISKPEQTTDNGFMRGRNVLSDPERLKFLEEHDPAGYAHVKQYLEDSKGDSDSRMEVR